MSFFDFTPTETERAFEVPYIEDARADYAPNYASGKTLDQAKADVGAELAKLGVSGFIFQEGTFGSSPKRYGYQVTFFLGSAKGVMRIAGLPIRNETPKKIAQVKVQALLCLRDQLKAAVIARVFNPLAHPLVGYLLVDGQRTVTEVVAAQGHLPALEGLDYQSAGGTIALPAGGAR